MAVLTSIQAAIQWLQQAELELQAQSNQTAAPLEPLRIAYGAKVSPDFKAKVIWIGENLACDPSWLMACMAFEDAETFKSDTKNAAGSGAVGLIQFMPGTAIRLGTTVQSLAVMSPEEQLKYVYRYFQPLAGRLHNLGDVYMAILWPGAVGKTDDYVLFDRAKAPIAYHENEGLDQDKDGRVTRGEALVHIQAKLTKGLTEGYVG